jgi:drug/metabolite transporter (DMT)-like permease
MQSNRFPILFSLFALYLIWGSAYYVIRVGVEFWPPLLLAGIRFLLAGMVLFVWARWHGHALPSWREIVSAAVLGFLLLAIGNGCVNMAETRVSSGVAALVLATDPLFITLCSCLFGARTCLRQWLAIGLGFVGIIILNLGASLSASPRAALLLMLANVAWALGSVLSQKLQQATGMMASAVMMLAGGVELLLGSAFMGERMSALPPTSGWIALIYLAIFGSIIAFNAYLYLLKHVSTTLATSYAYVNPVVAVIMGMWLLSEHVGAAEWCGMAVIVASVLLIIWHHKPDELDLVADLKP